MNIQQNTFGPSKRLTFKAPPNKALANYLKSAGEGETAVNDSVTLSEQATSEKASPSGARKMGTLIALSISAAGGLGLAGPVMAQEAATEVEIEQAEPFADFEEAGRQVREAGEEIGQEGKKIGRFFRRQFQRVREETRETREEIGEQGKEFGQNVGDAGRAFWRGLRGKSDQEPAPDQN